MVVHRKLLAINNIEKLAIEWRPSKVSTIRNELPAHVLLSQPLHDSQNTSKMKHNFPPMYDIHKFYIKVRLYDVCFSILSE